jgi:hypothetical protein
LATAGEILAGRQNEGLEVQNKLGLCTVANIGNKTYQNPDGTNFTVIIGKENGDGGSDLKSAAVDKAIRAITNAGFVLPDLKIYFSNAQGVPCVAYMGDNAGNAVYTIFMGPKTGQHNPQVAKSPGLKGGQGQTGMRGVADQLYDGTHRWFGNPKMHAHATCVVIHEIGHVLHDFQNAATFWDFKLNRAAGPAANGWLANAMKVSHYATTNPLEMVAETFSGAISGKTYNGNVRASYAALGGGMPQGGAAFP